MTPIIFIFSVPSDALPDRRVVNGKNVNNLDPRPWTVWLRKGRERLHCGGTILNESWVLTAASCLNNQINGVIGGVYDRTYIRGNEQVRNISATYQHPDFNATTLENDIGLIYLDTPFELNKIVQPLPCLTPDVLQGTGVEDIYNKQCRIAGWGQPDFMKGANFANPLKELTVQRVDDSICTRKFSDRPNSLICFEPYRRPELSSTCDGDQGGPYICKVRTEWYLTGVISAWNTDTACTDGFKGATKVLDNVEWIASVMNPVATTEGPSTEPTAAPTSGPSTEPIIPASNRDAIDVAREENEADLMIA